MKRRRLTDLYKPGATVKLNDGTGFQEVWVQKLSPVDHETAIRKANAARARQLMAARDPESEDYQAVWGDVEAFPDVDVLIEILVDDELTERRLAIEAETGAQKEWSDDSYLQGLYDAWNDGLYDRWIANNDDGEAKHVHDELERFNGQVTAAYQVEYEEGRNTYARLDRDDVVNKATKYFLERRAATAFLTEFQRAQIYYSTREPDNHRSYYFKDGIEEVDDLAEEVRDKLLQAYAEISVDPIEGKDSAGTPPSSTSSEPPEAEATEASSGQPAPTQ